VNICSNISYKAT